MNEDGSQLPIDVRGTFGSGSSIFGGQESTQQNQHGGHYTSTTNNRNRRNTA